MAISTAALRCAATPCCVRLPGRARTVAGTPLRRPLQRLGVLPDDRSDPLAAACPVPKDQQPIFQLKELQEDETFDLARRPLPQFSLSLAKSFGAFFFLMGLPVSCFTFEFSKEPAQCLLSAAAGSLFIVTVLVWRMYLGWDHVGARLQAATVPYEETGWYDGQLWVKTPEILARDRLAFAYQIRPTMARLKSTLLGLGGGFDRVTRWGRTRVLLLLLPLLLLPPQLLDNYSAPRSTAAAAASALEGRSYEDRVREYEPWADLEDGDDAANAAAAAAAGSILQHMRPLP
ncbi:Uncharacterized protein ycf36 [Monoraphidium neglectum]|uniref:Uncharacterized protein ycf36 n=1 Tax=Monoraphidium neglectum TaxID=145388 RepID=A0A0D2JM53_9CHLO|nr:Uncharacterized protein ycf36 [Monoraphidium neglectum]KIZ00283.1 Uncharacterized protein ycf36 [Monoraphidium neglectum]|eukprot:XP_013899302.1 Uncharacterized protein ycf36 [Monoraphidium neglectum]